MPQKSKGKVRNATKVDKYGLHFRSKLECYTYEAFMNAGIPVQYEPKHFELLPKFEYQQEKIRAMTYLPDFIGNGFIVECKGLMGDSFPLRWKLFKYYLKKHRSKIKCYLVRNHKQVDEMIQELLSQKKHGKTK
jgi:hypothetical protein|nr:MAG TPA: Endonuclease [Crassvirales sp.]